MILILYSTFLFYLLEYKKKYQCCQEEKEQLEIYQKQEVTRIKQLVSFTK